MSLLELARRLWVLVRRDTVDHDLQREMRLHLEMLAEDAEDWGAGRQEAVKAARRAFGNELALREGCHDATGRAVIDRLLQHAVRALRRDWKLASLATLVLALGIGGNATCSASSTPS